jgi:hypothetical protein
MASVQFLYYFLAAIVHLAETASYHQSTGQFGEEE